MKKDYAPESNEESLGVSRESHDYYATHARQWRDRVGLCVLAVVLIFWAYTLFATPFFSIQSVSILGLNKIQPQEMQDRIHSLLAQRRWRIIPRNNIFLLPVNNIVSYFKNDARIATIRAQKNYPERSLLVTIEERVPVYILALPDRAFAIDKEGVALIPLSVPPPPNALPIIIDTRQRNGILGEKVLPENDLKLFLLLQEDMQRIAPFNTITIGKPSDNALSLKTEEGWEAYFNLSDTPQAQIERLKVLLTAKIKPATRKKLQYIDLRFGERVYYK